MKRSGYIVLILSVLAAASCSRDPFVKTMRAGAKAYDRGDYTRAAGLFKETLQDTTFEGLYNYALASHEAEDDIEAIRALDTLRKQERVPEDYAVPAVLNLANARLTEAVRQEAKENGQEQVPQQEGMQGQKASTGLYQQAMQDYEEYLLEVPEDMDAKERYLFCKSKMPPQDENGGGGGGSDQNQDQQDQNQDQNQDQQNQDQNQNQDQDQQDQNQDKQDQQQQDQQQDQLNEQQIYQMLEAKEKETRDKLDEKKTRAIQLRQKDRKKW